MKMPKTLRVGGRTYRVIYPHSFDDMPKPLLGLCDNSKQVIRVSGRDISGATLCDRGDSDSGQVRSRHRKNLSYIVDIVVVSKYPPLSASCRYREHHGAVVGQDVARIGEVAQAGDQQALVQVDSDKVLPR